MKRLTFTLLFCGVAISGLFAQPVPAGNMPAVGSGFTMYSSTTAISQPSGGANQTWDYSTSNKSMLYNYTWVNVSGLSQAIKDSFPGATHATELSISGGVASTDMYKLTSGALYSLGAKGSGNSWTFHRPEWIVFNIPMSMGDTFGYQVFPGVWQKITYRGYGTLKTPLGTYTDVMCFRTDESDISDKFYVFIQCTPTYKKLAHFVIDSDGFSKNVFFYDFTGSGTGLADATSVNQVGIYPNPVKRGEVIRLKRASSSQKIELMNLLGERIQLFETGAEELPTASLSAGIYLVKITEGNNVMVNKLIVE